MSKLFSYDCDHYDVASEMLPKSEFWKDGYCALPRKKWLLWGICKEYIKQNIIKAVLRKANAYSVVICRLIKNNVNKMDPRGKIDSNFAYEVLVRTRILESLSNILAKKESYVTLQEAEIGR